ncbi:B- and T-lymphocyte attenuator isoform X2 [Kryptolebias marmoratus]|uniref:B- and T-lymphocyte attenuator isoform X2 n=1 Tax=Kryptolebias marmoratus TaxID=37003 RepID=UPI000D52F7B9|nr:B- and T-lymphocyte attenuator isoform X2 [Kryptolebias marmoratus]
MMTGGIMRPKSCWAVLNLSILAALFLTLKADSEDCTPGMMVRRNTDYKALPGEELRVECPVEFCSSSPPSVSWVKLEGTLVWVNISSNNRIKIEWKTVKQQGGVSYLIFQNINRSDSGSYRCESEGSLSHIIFITVGDQVKNTNDTSKETTNAPSSEKSELEEQIMMYVYCAAGTGAFIIIVIIVTMIAMKGCKRKPKLETQTDNQYIEIPLAEQATPRPSSLQPSPRGSPIPPPSRRPSERKTPRQPNELRSGNKEQLYDQRKQNRNRQRNAEPAEENNSVVYAALNHGASPRTSARPQREVEETEYAAIRLV